MKEPFYCDAKLNSNISQTFVQLYKVAVSMHKTFVRFYVHFSSKINNDSTIMIMKYELDQFLEFYGGVPVDPTP